jgi:hypothetical protein
MSTTSQSLVAFVFRQNGVPTRAASSLQVADKVGLQPSSETVFAARRDQPIGNQHKGSITEGYAIVAAALLDPCMAR